MATEQEPRPAESIARSVPERQPIAWQPFTPGGVARFAKVTFANVMLVELVASALLTASVFWFLSTVWFPGVREAIERLPESAVIHRGMLEWPPRGESAPYPSALILLENRFLGCAIDPAPRTTSLASDVRVVFGRDDVMVCSLFGCLEYRYSPAYIIELNRREAVPWWGAWRPIILALVTIAVPLLLLAFWAALAALYCPLVWLIAFYADRELTWSGSWRLVAAALVPGAVFLAAAIIAYGSKSVDLVQFLILCGLHLAVGLAYAVISPFFLPRLIPKPRNPFASGAAV